MSTGETPIPDPIRPSRRPLVLLGTEITTPPIPTETRRRIGFLLAQVQEGVALGLPISRPMPSIGPGCHELRLSDDRGEWRVVYQVRPTIILVAEVFRKKTRATPKGVIDRCRRRFNEAE